MGIRPDEYKFYANFKKKVLEPTRIELKNGTDLNFDYKEKKQGHKVVHLLFKIKSQKINTVGPEDPAGDEIEIKNIELNKKLQEYYRLSRDQAKWVLQEYDKDQDRILQNLKYVEKRFETGDVKNIGSYTVKAIKHNYTDQPSLFEVEKEEKEKKFKTQQFEKEVQERRRQDYERYVKGQVEQFKKTLPDSQIDKIRQKVTSEIESQYKRKSAGFDKMVDIGMLSYFKKEAGLPEFEDWAKEIAHE
jgi:plasmid replication initiation protein